MVEKYAVPLTFLLVRDDDAWVSIACEIYVGSQGPSADEARAMLKEALRISVSSAVELGQADDLGSPIPAEDLAELLDVPREHVVVEYHTMLLSVETEPQPHLISIEFFRSSVTPVGCQLPAAA